MIRFLGRILRALAKGVGYFVCFIIVLYSLLFVQSYFNKKFIRLEMPGGAYFAPAYWLSWPSPVTDKIAFYRADGKMLMQPSVEFICFNDRFIEASFYRPGRGFIYEAGADDVVRSSDPSYDDVLARMKAYSNGRGCEGAFGRRTGYSLLLHSKNPNVKTRRVFEWLLE